MNSFGEFLSMGGKGGFVWSAYAIGLVVLVLITMISKAQLEKTKKEIQRKNRQSSQS